MWSMLFDVKSRRIAVKKTIFHCKNWVTYIQ